MSFDLALPPEIYILVNLYKECFGFTDGHTKTGTVCTCTPASYVVDNECLWLNVGMSRYRRPTISAVTQWLFGLRLWKEGSQKVSVSCGDKAGQTVQLGPRPSVQAPHLARPTQAPIHHGILPSVTRAAPLGAIGCWLHGVRRAKVVCAFIGPLLPQIPKVGETESLWLHFGCGVEGHEVTGLYYLSLFLLSVGSDQQVEVRGQVPSK